MLQLVHMSSADGGQRVGVLQNVFGDIFLFPVWWYGKGLIQSAKFALSFVTGYSRRLGFMVWVKNIFTPMFGRYDWQSRIISVFMRIMNIIIRGFLIALVAVISLSGFIVYLALPILAIVFVVFHASAIFS